MKRYGLLDAVRGTALISMVFYHLLWDLVYLFDVEIEWYGGIIGVVWQRSICMTFILLAGYCRRLCHGFKRGITVFVCGALITAVTLFVIPDEPIIFGILTFLGSADLIFAAVGNTLKKLSAIVGAVLSICFYYAFVNVGNGAVLWFELPQKMYSGIISSFFGFQSDGFVSSDYFPLLPWIFLYATGFYLCGIVKATDRADGIMSLHCPPLEFVGRHSLEIYMLHQPILYGICSLVCYFSGIMG